MPVILKEKLIQFIINQELRTGKAIREHKGTTEETAAGAGNRVKKL